MAGKHAFYTTITKNKQSAAKSLMLQKTIPPPKTMKNDSQTEEGTVDPLTLLAIAEAAAAAEAAVGVATGAAAATIGFSWTDSAASLSASSKSWIHFICICPTTEPWTLPYS